MKAKKNNKKVVRPKETLTLEGVKKAIEDVVLPSHNNLRLEIDTKIENLAIMMARSFKEIDGKISTTDQRLVLAREEILRKLDSTNIRIDDLAFNRVKYTDFDILKKDVELLKTKFSNKRQT
ncbi:MAG: hypothetical protein V4467_01295 [Patescibacteria group bacterium]